MLKSLASSTTSLVLLFLTLSTTSCLADPMFSFFDFTYPTVDMDSLDGDETMDGRILSANGGFSLTNSTISVSALLAAGLLGESEIMLVTKV
jgi:hypothetical protein